MEELPKNVRMQASGPVVSPRGGGNVVGISRATVPPQKFERQVRWLAQRGYVGIRASDWLEWCREGKALPDKPVLLTFDDAYADVAENALPVLKRYGFSGVVFVVTECLGGANTWDRGAWGAELQIMTAEQVRHWASEGIEFGGHTRTHADLKSLDAARLEEEVEGGARGLARSIQARAVCFAYPYGEYNDAAQQCAQKAFAMAFTCDEGLNDLTTPPHRLRRTMVDPRDSLIDFWPRVHWGYSPVRACAGASSFGRALNVQCASFLGGARHEERLMVKMLTKAPSTVASTPWGRLRRGIHGIRWLRSTWYLVLAVRLCFETDRRKPQENPINNTEVTRIHGATGRPGGNNIST